MSRPPAPLTGRWRAVRVAALGLASLLLAGSAHLVGGGALPGPGVLLVLAGLLGLAGVLVTARRVRLPLLITVLGVEQVGLHLALDLTSHAGHCTQTAHHVAACAPGAAAMGSSPAMIIGHGLAVLATAWLLGRGEAWLWGLADRLVRTAAATLTVITDGGRPRALVPVVVYASVRGRAGGPRGPPAGR